MTKKELENRLDQIKYIIKHHRTTMQDIIGEGTDNPYASGILEAYRQMDRTIQRLEEQDARNKG